MVRGCEYEHNPPRSVGGVAHTIFRDVRTEKCKSKCRPTLLWGHNYTCSQRVTLYTYRL